MISLLFRPSITNYEIYVKQGDGQNEENSIGHNEQTLTGEIFFHL